VFVLLKKRFGLRVFLKGLVDFYNLENCPCRCRILIIFKAGSIFAGLYVLKLRM